MSGYKEQIHLNLNALFYGVKQLIEEYENGDEDAVAQIIQDLSKVTTNIDICLAADDAPSYEEMN